MEDDIDKALSLISSNSVGSDCISAKMLRLCCPLLLQYFRHIFNFCITNSTFPSCWKESLLLPLPKVKNPTQLSELRPISILPVLSKMFERVLAEQLRTHINSCAILPSYQSGFRSGYSCASALLSVIDDIFKALDSGHMAALVLLDYSKAFDTINHQLLISILHYIGLGVASTSLIQAYINKIANFMSMLMIRKFTKLSILTILMFVKTWLTLT